MFVLGDSGALLGGDEAYQTLCVKRYSESPLGLLVFWIGHLWTSWLGFSFLNLRVLASLEMTLAVLVTSFYCYRLTSNTRLASIMFLFGCIVSRCGCSHVYNWDTGTYLFDTIALCLTVSCLRSPSIIKCIGLGVSIALMAMGRVPSVIFLPIALVLIWISLRNSKSFASIIRYEGVITISFLATAIILSFVIIGSPSRYISLFTAENMVSGHSPTNDTFLVLERFIWMLAGTPTIWFFGTVSLLLPILTIKIKQKKYKALTLLPWLVFAILFSYWSTPTNHSPWVMLSMGDPLIFGLLLSPCLYGIFNKGIIVDRQLKLALWACALLIASIAFGSDRFFERLSVGFPLPVITGLLWKLRKGSFHAYLKSALCVSLLTFGSMLTMHLARLYFISSREPRLTIHPFEGLRQDGEMYNEISPALDALSKVHNQKITYICLFDNKLAELVTGDISPVRLHEFHAFLMKKDYWLKNKDSLLPNVEAVVYIPAQKRRFYDLDWVVSDIEKQGFDKKETVGDAVILYRNRKLENPDSLKAIE